jgi:Double-GTPase 1
VGVLAAPPMKIVLLGEQATGKSSLLVALYGALVNRRAGEMRIIRTVDDVEFLSRGLQALGRRQSVQRTEVDGQARLLIDVAHQDAVVSIELPDRSGELVRHMIEARQWEGELQRQLAGATGAILCLRADHVHAGTPMNLMPEPACATVPADDAPPTPPPWRPGQMPADARAVDLLQAVLEDRTTMLPLAVVISAWDRARVPMAPDGWLAEHVPLLDQFLATHDGALPHRTYGVSAQGGEFAAGPGEPAADDDPWDRTYLVGPDGTRGTIADPVAWLIDNAM